MRCSNCFCVYEAGEVCPKCGQKRDVDTIEPYFLLAGTTLQEERYFVGKVVGSGGFGITYAAWDGLLNRKVAIKEYLPGEFSTRMQNAAKVTVYGGEKTEQFERGLEKFYEESLRLAKFNEVPGIVQIYDCFRENGTAYIVMEFLEGETLGEYLKREEKMPVEEAVQVVTQVLDALEIVHKADIIHRDIAPNNIFLCSDGNVKLLDFGAARYATGTKNESLTVLYKEGYTAEEQYRSRGEQGPWTDVYAMAATLYKMITGVVPDGAMERRRKDRLKAPRKVGVHIPANVEKALLNALNIDAKKRTQSALQFREELCGEKRVANRFERTKENRVARIPVGLAVIIIVATLGIGTLIALFYAGVITFDLGSFDSSALGEGEARVISVLNMKEEEARTKLAEIGLELEVVELKYTNKVQEGRIISQQEEKGEVVAQGSVVHVVVSKGAGTIEMPDLVSMEWETAKVLLEELCLEYSHITVANEAPPGYIVKHTPVKGKKIEQGQTVEVVVSEGKGYNTSVVSVMTNLEGRHYQQVKGELAQMGIYLVVEGYEYSDDIYKGCIISQNVSEGTQVHGEDVVSVLVSLGKKLPEPADDYVIDWKDENLEKTMRIRTGIYTGEITYGDVKKFKSLSLEGCGIKDISALGDLTNLENLCLNDNNISNIDVLSNLLNLRKLELKNNSISNINVLKEITDLEYLDLSYNSISNISALKGLVNLKQLFLDENQISNISALGELKNLTELKLAFNQVTDIKSLSGLVNLEVLDLQMNNIIDINTLRNMTQLRYLCLSYSDLSDISPLSSLTNLNDLWLVGTQVRDISVLAGLTNLRSLSIRESTVHDISALANLTKLQWLYLQDNQIRDISALSNLPNLDRLCLEGNPITDYSPVSYVPDLTY